MTGGDRD